MIAPVQVPSLGVCITGEKKADGGLLITIWRPWRNAWLPINSPLTAVLDR